MVIASSVTTSVQLTIHWRHSRRQAEALFASVASGRNGPVFGRTRTWSVAQGVYTSAQLADKSERSPGLAPPASTSLSAGVDLALAEASKANQRLLIFLNSRGRKDELS